jgi:hypothetical protein
MHDEELLAAQRSMVEQLDEIARHARLISHELAHIRSMMVAVIFVSACAAMSFAIT